MRETYRSHGVGKALLCQVAGIARKESHRTTRAMVCKIAKQTTEMLGVAADYLQIDVRFGYAGEAYGIPTASSLQAIGLLARLEGILVDPVYEAKSLAGLIDLARKGEFRKEDRILFLHLGGTPVIHAYAQCFTNLNRSLLLGPDPCALNYGTNRTGNDV